MPIVQARRRVDVARRKQDAHSVLGFGGRRYVEAAGRASAERERD
jgi:hypothetical protein